MDNKTEIRNEIENGILGGRWCKDCTGGTYYIVAAVETDEDYYYVGIDQDRKINFLSCVGNIEVIDNYSHLNSGMIGYLIKFEHDTIVNDIKRYISTIKDELFTKICIEGQLY